MAVGLVEPDRLHQADLPMVRHVAVAQSVPSNVWLAS
ncbi:hypothetical protein JOE50_003740 [Bradyrhizobium japonicum]|nr:hypothetical protein [Bradyrhizobium japonicum]